MQEDKTQVTDEMTATIDTSATGPRMVSVVVKVASGIFKNGQHYPAGSTAVISEQSAMRFASLGEVEILSGNTTSETGNA